MAKVNNKTIHGKIGDVLYRTWKDVQYISTVPAKKNIPDSMAQKENSAGFAVCCKLGAVMVRIMTLADHWEKAEVDACMTRTKFVKFNRANVKSGGDVSGVQLVADKDLQSIIISHYNLSEIELSCTFEIQIPDKFCKEISMQSIVQLTEPKEPALESISFFPLVSPNYRLENESVITMKAKFSSHEIELMKMYANVNILLNLAFKNVQGKVRKFSETKYL